MIDCEIEFDLRWSKYCVISEILTTAQVAGNNPVNGTKTKGATFQINNATIYVIAVTLSINDNRNF